MGVFGFVARRVVVMEMVSAALIGSGVGAVIGLALLGYSTYTLLACDYEKLKESIINEERKNYSNLKQIIEKNILLKRKKLYDNY